MFLWSFSALICKSLGWQLFRTIVSFKVPQIHLLFKLTQVLEADGLDFTSDLMSFP